MYIRGICKKCHRTGFVDIGILPVDEARRLLDKLEFGECQFGGYHVEFGSMSDYVVFDFDSISNSKEKANAKVYTQEIESFGYGSRITVETNEEFTDCRFLYYTPTNNRLFMTVLRDKEVLKIPISDILSIDGKEINKYVAKAN